MNTNYVYNNGHLQINHQANIKTQGTDLALNFKTLAMDLQNMSALRKTIQVR